MARNPALMNPVLGDTDAQHGHQHHSHRMKMREIRHHRGHERSERLARKLIDDHQRLAITRIGQAKVDAGQGP
jgi:hypothetical protein